MRTWASWIAAGLLAFWIAGLTRGDDKNPSIEEIMDKAHNTKAGLRAQIAAEVAKANPDWANIQKQSKEWVVLVSSLGKQMPPQGDKESWARMTQAFAKLVQSLDAAAAKKDVAGVKAANMKIAASCTACHKVHRP